MCFTHPFIRGIRGIMYVCGWCNCFCDFLVIGWLCLSVICVDYIVMCLSFSVTVIMDAFVLFSVTLLVCTLSLVRIIINASNFSFTVCTVSAGVACDFRVIFLVIIGFLWITVVFGDSGVLWIHTLCLGISYIIIVIISVVRCTCEAMKNTLVNLSWVGIRKILEESRRRWVCAIRFWVNRRTRYRWCMRCIHAWICVPLDCLNLSKFSN